MRARVWLTNLMLVSFVVACGDQPTEVVPERGGEIQGAGTVALATSSTEDGLVITTDKDDYAPGDTVWFTGSGWPADDTLDILLEDEPMTHPPHEWWVPVEGNGTFRDSTYVVDAEDLGVTFTLTATSRATGRSLSVMFTDGNLNSLALSPNTRSVPPTGSAAYSIDVGMTGSGSTCTVTLSVLASPVLPAGAVPSIPSNVVSATNANFSRTLTITTTGVTPGSYPFTVQAARGTNCQGSGNLTVNGTLVVFGPATKLAFDQQPTDEDATVTITPAVTVRVLDANNNLVANSTAPVTMAIGSNPGSGTLSGTLLQNAVDGVASFPNLSIDKVGTGYRLAATSGSLTGATSGLFNITVGPATQLAFSSQPSGGAPNMAFSTQPAVEVQDAGGNRKTTAAGSGANINLAIVSGTGTAGAVLTCTTNPLGASAGLATFAGCRINLAGTGYRLRATTTISGNPFSADSDPFDVVAANAAPTVNAGGPYTVAEGTELTLSPTVNDPDGDALDYKWTVNKSGIDADGECTFDDDTAPNAKLTCTDDSQGAPDSKFSVTLEVDDGNGHVVSDAADLTVTNANPTASAGGPYSNNEGTAMQLSGTGDDAGDNDVAGLTFEWSVNQTGIDTGGDCEFLPNNTAQNPTITCDDDSQDAAGGKFSVSLIVRDDDSGVSTTSTTDLEVLNVNPTADAGGPYSGNEGSAISLTGTGDDDGANDVAGLTYEWSVSQTGIDAGGNCTFSPNNTAQNPSITCSDDSDQAAGGDFSVSLVVRDNDSGISSTSTADLDVNNVAPTIQSMTLPPNGDPLPGSIGISGTLQIEVAFGDPGSDTHTAEIDCGTGSYTDVNGGSNVSSPLTTSCTFTAIGSKTVRVRVEDDDDGYDVESHVILVSYVFQGFSTPVDRPNTLNMSKAGQAIPLKWRLTDANGIGVTNANVVTVKAVALSCIQGSSTDQIEEYAAGSSGLQNLGDGYYQFNWKTPAGYAGSCKSIALIFGTVPPGQTQGPDGYTEGPHAWFTFKK